MYYYRILYDMISDIFDDEYHDNINNTRDYDVKGLFFGCRVYYNIPT